MRYIISYLLITSYLFAFDYHLKPYALSDKINCFFGLPSQVTNQNGGNLINSCYIETKEGYIVIDSGPTYSYAKDTYTLMQKLHKIPVKYVISTSINDENVLGNGFFKERGATIIGPLSYKNKVEDYKNFSLFTQLSKEVMINTKIIPFDEYVRKNIILLLGGLEINIKVLREDSSHLMIFLPSKEIVFSGDIIYNNRMVSFEDNRSLLVWEKHLDELKILPWKDIVSAHGYMTRRSALEHTEKYLKLLKEKILKALKHSLTKKETLKQVQMLDYSHDRLYKIWHHRNVAIVYDELKNNNILFNSSVNVVKKDSITVRSKSKIIIPSVEIKKKKKVIVKKKKLRKKIPSIHYVNFETAIKQAQSKHKLVFLKIRSTDCKYCDQLDGTLKHNRDARRLIAKYFEIVEINEDYEEIPVDVRISRTPTIIFLRPDNKKILMHFSGIQPLGELLEILNELVTDGHNGGYLKP